jgi:hypothetical protein
MDQSKPQRNAAVQCCPLGSTGLTVNAIISAATPGKLSESTPWT